LIKKFLKPLIRYLDVLFSSPSEAVYQESSARAQINVGEPAPGEPLARFVYDSSGFGKNQSTDASRIKAKAFLPLFNEKTSNFETSVFRVSGLSKKIIRDELSLTARSDKIPKGAGHIRVRHVLDAKLELDPNNIPERHANIVKWPTDKEDQKELAQELVNEAQCERYL
jgi:hypothetical protein